MSPVPRKILKPSPIPCPCKARDELIGSILASFSQPHNVKKDLEARLLTCLEQHNFSLYNSYLQRFSDCPIIRRVSQGVYITLAWTSSAPKWVHMDSPLICFMLNSHIKIKNRINPLRNRHLHSQTITLGINEYRVQLLPNYTNSEWLPYSTGLMGQIKTIA